MLFIKTQKCNCSICQCGGACNNVNGYTLLDSLAIETKINTLLDKEIASTLAGSEPFQLSQIKDYYLDKEEARFSAGSYLP